MDPAEDTDGQRVPQDPAKDAITTILDIAQPISVLHARRPPRDVSDPGAHEVLDPHVVAQERAPPAVVVSCHPGDQHTIVHQVGECGENPVARLRNHPLPLEPEVEQVAIDDQRARIAADVAEERQEESLGVAVGHAQVGVRNDVRR